jgi:hypothetical protein
MTCVVKTRGVTGSLRPSGLVNGGKITKVTLSDSAWTLLPPTPLSGRNAMRIQNRSGSKIYLQYDNTEPVNDGMELDSGGENFYDITDTIPLYASADVNGAVIRVEELS